MRTMALWERRSNWGKSFTLARDPTSPLRSCTAEVVCGGGGWNFSSESVARLGFCRGLLASFFVHFGGRGGQNGVHFGWFSGLVASMGALDAQFAPGPPSPFQPRSL